MPGKGPTAPTSGGLRPGRKNAMMRENAVITWGEMTAALLTLGITTFLLLI